MTGANLNNPIGTALSPVLTSLVNLGYTDVSYNPTTGIYERLLDEADVPTAFGTLPADVDWEQVPGHLVNNLVTGIQKAISDGLVSQTPVSNPIKTLLGLLGVGNSATGSALDLSALTDVGTQALTKTSFEPQAITKTNVGTETVNLKSVADVPAGDGNAEKLSTGADDARRELDKSVEAAGERTKASAAKAREHTAKAVKDAQERVNKLAADGRKQIKSAADGLQRGAEKAVGDVKDGVKKAGESVKPAKKAEKKAEKDAKSDAA
ncbi:AAA ATPase containing von Willebrand factor type A (VWA) domain-like protein [Mycolicibacterium fortuitum]|uniref:AAA ATPase containing von Willebrand factor type A (VWA) domain-like protein n=1 Tax=Mycolicibacterium fortuitum TaxID=1766 RepID=A0A378V1I3_MYCFO|nr:AAA ATPase containing von Willebrand factor type A (VWA) domain-like protein [Mycolicibacterium fortuitum]